MARLGDVCKKGTSNIAQKDLEGHIGIYPIYGASGFITNVDFYQQEKPYIAVVKDGAGIGRIMKLPAKSSVIGTMQYIIPNDMVDISFLAYAMEHMNLSKYFTGATIPHIYFKDYQREEIPLPPLEEQRKIAAVLDKVSDLIAKRRQQLDRLDELVKSRFVEMFGDCDLSKAQTSWMTIKDIGTVASGATPKTEQEEFWGGPYRWITPAELEADSGYIFDSVRKLTKAGVESCSLQEMPTGTVLLSSRAPIGKLAIAGNPFYCNQGFKNIICNETIIPRYLYTLLLLNVDYLNSLGRGATFKEISKTIVENICIPVPPLDLQNRFAAFVAQTDKAKTAVQKSLEKLETLKKALMQSFFSKE